MAKKPVTPVRPVIRKIRPANSVAELQDRISPSTDGDITIPGRMSDWLTPRPRGTSPLDPVLIAARNAGTHTSKKKKPRIPTIAAADVSLGADGLPRPGRR